MPKPLVLTWSRAQGDAWCDLFAVDLSQPHFQGLEGVFVVWHGGKSSHTVRVGSGPIRERLEALRLDPEVRAFRDQALFVTWAPVERALRLGVERFLAESLQPRLKGLVPESLPIEVNLPGRDGVVGARVGQNWQEMARREGEAPSALKARDVEVMTPPPRQASAPAAPAPAMESPRVKTVSNLQKAFSELLEQSKGSKGGFFGGGRPKTEDESLVVNVVQLIMKEAVRMRASDVHMEPLEKGLRIRFRVDGMLEEILEIPAALNMRVISHIRVMCGLDPEKSIGTAKPEDGRMAVTVDRIEADLRLSTFPTAFGDKAVLRIIPRNVKARQLEELGMPQKIAERVRDLAFRPQGMIVVTGPAGSGKSTTLYAILQTLNTSTRNIVTLEDPIELKIPGITQGAVQPKVGFTFSDGLRAILRQDPNVVMVGEIRDSETAEIAMSAALTGHMLLTTLHTNSALGAVTRLLDMGLEPFLIGAALSGIFAQRLARQICPKCREAYDPAPGELAQIEEVAKRTGVRLPAGHLKELYRGKGCPECRDTGFLGRVLLFEFVQISPALRQLILRKASMAELAQVAVSEGAQTLLMDGLQKAAAGLTTVSELVRVVGIDD